MGHTSLILFDMDGVLVDVTGSYREVTRLSVLLYLREVVGARIQDEGFLPLADVASIKKSGGLNNDWDLTDSIISAYLMHSLSGIEGSLVREFIALREVDEDGALLLELRPLFERIDLSTLESLASESRAPDLFHRIPDVWHPNQEHRIFSMGYPMSSLQSTSAPTALGGSHPCS
jgi:phosphoglycolate phosphatase-like HAD superfamily hydrolase